MDHFATQGALVATLLGTAHVTAAENIKSFINNDSNNNINWIPAYVNNYNTMKEVLRQGVFNVLYFSVHRPEHESVGKTNPLYIISIYSILTSNFYN